MSGTFNTRQLLNNTAFLLVMASLMVPFRTAWSAESRMLVLDVSGSMWGQIDGKTKIDIARDVLKNLVSDWPDDTEVGLVVYGHSQKGDCSDIEVLVPPGPLDPAGLVQKISTLVPVGKTPLSDAVRLGADALKFTENKSTVVLISDGKETCDRDPCALGLELEKLGVDFTAHVIGFDVASREDQDSLRCLAENTGGDFLVATNSGELREALEKTAKPPAPATEAMPDVQLVAAEAVDRNADFYVEIIADEGLDGRVYLYAEGQESPVTYQRIQRSASGGYKPAQLRAPAVSGNYTLRFVALNGKDVLAERPIAVIDTPVSLDASDDNRNDDEIFLEAESSALVSSSIGVTLKAPPNQEGRIGIYKPRDQQPHAYQRVSTDNSGSYKPIVLRTPAVAGDYVLEFRSLKNEPIANKPLLIKAANIAIEAPSSAPIATTISAILIAPVGIEGQLHLHHAGQNKPVDSHTVSIDSNNEYKPVEFQLPVLPGNYEIRFTSLNDDLMATTAITAVFTEIGLNAPSRASTGEIIEVIPFGPPGLDGRVHLEIEGQEKSGPTQRIRTGTTSDYAPLRFRIPDQEGPYVFRFFSLQQELLAEEQIVVND